MDGVVGDLLFILTFFVVPTLILVGCIVLWRSLDRQAEQWSGDQHVVHGEAALLSASRQTDRDDGEVGEGGAAGEVQRASATAEAHELQDSEQTTEVQLPPATAPVMIPEDSQDGGEGDSTRSRQRLDARAVRARRRRARSTSTLQQHSGQDVRSRGDDPQR